MELLSLIVGLATKVAHVSPPYKKRLVIGVIDWEKPQYICKWHFVYLRIK